MNLTHRSFFTGRGGFDIGAERAGFETLSTCEKDKWLRNTIFKPCFPNAVHYDDISAIKTIGTATVFSAGFPCQDISQAGKGAGLFSAESSLFFEFVYLCGKGRPEYIILENSPILLVRGMEWVTAALSQIGYMCEWECLHASDFGYPHERERIYVISYPYKNRRKSLFYNGGSVTVFSFFMVLIDVFVCKCRQIFYRG
jgi:DNA (cytosine-5)-methyltransferase 1